MVNSKERELNVLFEHFITHFWVFEANEIGKIYEQLSPLDKEIFPFDLQ